MPGDDWDEIDPKKGPPPIPKDAPPLRRGGRMGWFMAVLAVIVAAALWGKTLEHRAEEREALARARDEAAELRRKLFSVEADRNDAKKERDVHANTAAHLETALARKGAESEETEKLIRDLKSQLGDKEGDVGTKDGRITVSLVDQILFPSGEAELQPRGKQVLAKVGAVLKGLKDQQLLVGGHTDDVPIKTARFPSNWELSAARAVHVARFLVEEAGVDPHQVVAAGYSEFHPRSTDRAQNRRTEIVLTPKVEVKAGQ